LFSPIQINPLI